MRVSDCCMDPDISKTPSLQDEYRAALKGKDGDLRHGRATYVVMSCMKKLLWPQ